MNLYQKLAEIKKAINCPKTRNSDDCTYKYRNLEDIEKAVKPFEEKHNVLFLCTDEMVEIARFPYIKATATILDLDNNNNKISASSYAREDTRGFMIAPQQTLIATSYARKSAYNALLELDDAPNVEGETKDDETDNSAEKADDANTSETKEEKSEDNKKTQEDENSKKPEKATEQKSDKAEEETQDKEKTETSPEPKPVFTTIEEAAAVLIEYTPEAKQRGKEGQPISVLSDQQLQRISTTKLATARTKAAAIALLSLKRKEAAKSELPRTLQEAVEVCVEYVNPEDSEKYKDYAGKPIMEFSDEIIGKFAQSSKVTERTRKAAQIIMSS